jgi:hypothetical protein
MGICFPINENYYFSMRVLQVIQINLPRSVPFKVKKMDNLFSGSSIMPQP